MIKWVELDLGHMQGETTSTAKSASLCTFSLDWISRDFLLAKTCRWLETWRKTGRRDRKERKRERKRRRDITIKERDCASTHLDAGLIFSHPLTCQNLNVTRYLWGPSLSPWKQTQSKGWYFNLNSHNWYRNCSVRFVHTCLRVRVFPVRSFM